MPPTIVLVFGCIAVVLCFDASRSRFERFLEWVFAPWPLWFAVSSALVVMMLFRHTLVDHKQAFERAGLLLQVLGILAVVHGASQKLEAFGKRGLGGLLGDWVLQFFAIFPSRRNKFMHIGTGHLRALGGGGAASFGRKKPNGVDERLTQLEEDVVRLEGELKSVKQALDKERGERIAADDFAQATMADKFAKMRALVEKTSVGAFNEEIVGLVWLVFSAVCTTLSADLALRW